MNSIQRHAPAVAVQNNLDTNTSDRHILLIGVDGALWEEIAAAELPIFSRLKQQGSWHAMEMEVPTISGPGWASILTGTNHATHGIRDNSLVGSRHWNCPDVLSRAFYENQNTRTFAAAGWPVLVDPQGLGPLIHPRLEQQYAGLHNVIVRDGETHGYERVDAEIAAITTAKLRGDGFDFGFVYFCDADDAGHVYGIREGVDQGAAYRAALGRIDTHLQQLISAVEWRCTTQDEDWLVVVTTDHGHRPAGGHGGASAAERASWVLCYCPTGTLPNWPAQLEPASLATRLLAARRGSAAAAP